MTETESRRLRREYEDLGLVRDEMADNPMSQFEDWFGAAITAGIDEPNAFILATVADTGGPSARAVLLKEVTSKSIIFYTNFESRKSLEIKANPHVAATFVWTPIHRQIRFEGLASIVDEEKSDAYFATRPRGAQLAAHVSRQSQPVADRGVLEERFAEADVRFGEIVPRPAQWGGWEIVPDRAEYWQGRPNRFHDRMVYIRDGDEWRVERLQP